VSDDTNHNDDGETNDVGTDDASRVTSSSSQSRWVKECDEKKVSIHDEEEAWMDTDSSGEFDLPPQLIEVQRIKVLQKKERESSAISEPGAYDSIDGSVRVKYQSFRQ
jgi:hypothetical protein